MKCLLFFCCIYLGLSSYAFSQCLSEMKTIEWIQQLAEGAAAVSGKQDSAAADLTHSSQKIRKSVFGQTESGSQFYVVIWDRVNTLGFRRTL